MGTKRVGLARMQALLENLKRTLTLGTATISAASLTATTGGLVVTAGETYLRGSHAVIKHQGAPSIGADSAAAFTDANILAQIITVAATAARAKVLPAAANLISTLKLTANNDSADIHIINTGTGSDTVTVSGGGLVGSGLIAVSSSATFRVRRVNGSTVATYRLA